MDSLTEQTIKSSKITKQMLIGLHLEKEYEQNAREVVSSLVNEAGFDALDAGFEAGTLEDSGYAGRFMETAGGDSRLGVLHIVPPQLKEARKVAQRELLTEKQDPFQ